LTTAYPSACKFSGSLYSQARCAACDTSDNCDNRNREQRTEYWQRGIGTHPEVERSNANPPIREAPVQAASQGGL
jgi:hypothetical protein